MLSLLKNLLPFKFNATLLIGGLILLIIYLLIDTYLTYHNSLIETGEKIGVNKMKDVNRQAVQEQINESKEIINDTRSLDDNELDQRLRKYHVQQSKVGTNRSRILSEPSDNDIRSFYQYLRSKSENADIDSQSPRRKRTECFDNYYDPDYGLIEGECISYE